ncbi:TPA: LOW QUALITY PROTEIN: hypothetical protein N0F65_009157 [Lagenidium giganteum]|uniref:SWIM-type domain-containing protein n=1 Tax=Lagenidium giganteum TaxID=4803 RepID=A0AAV2YRF9_9STRA|nr:TPA: LOW QUALITY PROTEIN: hypothetical protein N0F65_009157 [Lagenidium giganteum]
MLQRNLDDDDACAAVVARFVAEDEKNAVTVDQAASGLTGAISLSSRFMRESFARFPELLLMDTTHKTNRNNYQLCTFMVADEYGDGRVVQHSVFETNGDWHMTKALDHLVRTNADAVQSLWSTKISRMFPRVRVLICHFHVIKYLKLSSGKNHTADSIDREALDNIEHNMVYARSEEVYTEERESLRILCQRANILKFFYYMERNWHDCQDKWVMNRRAKLPHFSTHTNNPLESFFGKLKGVVSSQSTMHELLKATISHQRRVVNEVVHRNKIEQRINPSYDAELRMVLRFTTHYIADKIAGQYASALNKADRFQFEEDAESDSVVVHGRNSSYNLGLAAFSCTCGFSCAMRLPCQHMMAYRHKSPKFSTVITVEMIADSSVDLSRIGFQFHLFKRKRYAEEGSSDDADEDPWLTAAERYKEACRLTHAIKDELADVTSEREFRETSAIPVNIDNSHWCAIVAHIREKRLAYYDPTENSETVLAHVCRDLCVSGFDKFKVVNDPRPIQFDGHNCGVYILLKFWSTVWTHISDSFQLPDLSSLTALEKLRYEMLHYILNGNTENRVTATETEVEDTCTATNEEESKDA